MLRRLFGGNAAEKPEQPEFIRIRDGYDTSYMPNPLFKKPNFQRPDGIDLTVPNRSGTALGRIARTLSLSVALTAASVVGINEATKDENGNNGFFQSTIDTVTNTAISALPFKWIEFNSKEVDNLAVF